MPFHRSIHPGKASPTRYNKQEHGGKQEQVPDSREGKDAELTGEKAAETVDEERKALAGGDARRHAVTSRPQAATSRRRLLFSCAASRASRLASSSRRAVADSR
jgi:hypothetical protein